jgi:hypothetical protein
VTGVVSTVKPPDEEGEGWVKIWVDEAIESSSKLWLQKPQLKLMTALGGCMCEEKDRIIEGLRTQLANLRSAVDGEYITWAAEDELSTDEEKDAKRIEAINTASDRLALAESVSEDLHVKMMRARDQCAVVEKERDVLRDLLAVVNRDGGHRAEEVGYKQATKEALAAYYALVKRVGKLESSGNLESLAKLESLEKLAIMVGVAGEFSQYREGKWIKEITDAIIAGLKRKEREEALELSAQTMEAYALTIMSPAMNDRHFIKAAALIRDLK